MDMTDRLWSVVFRLAMAGELLLFGLDVCFSISWLPLGGGHIEQIALLFIFAFVLLEAIDSIRHLKGYR